MQIRMSHRVLVRDEAGPSSSRKFFWEERVQYFFFSYFSCWLLTAPSIADVICAANLDNETTAPSYFDTGTRSLYFYRARAVHALSKENTAYRFQVFKLRAMMRATSEQTFYRQYAGYGLRENSAYLDSRRKREDFPFS